MKIAQLKTRVVELPVETLLDVKAVSIKATWHYVILEMFTDSGMVGIGITFFGGL